MSGETISLVWVINLPCACLTHLFLVGVAVVLLDVLDVVVEVAPVVPRAELGVAFHVQELVRLLQVALRSRSGSGGGELGQGRRGPEECPRPPPVHPAAAVGLIGLQTASEVTAAAAAAGTTAVEEIFVVILLRVEIG